MIAMKSIFPWELEWSASIQMVVVHGMRIRISHKALDIRQPHFGRFPTRLGSSFSSSNSSKSIRTAARCAMQQESSLPISIGVFEFLCQGLARFSWGFVL